MAGALFAAIGPPNRRAHGGRDRVYRVQPKTDALVNRYYNAYDVPGERKKSESSTARSSPAALSRARPEE